MEHSVIVADIKDLKDWYNVTENEFKRAGGGGLHAHYRSMSKLLFTIFPKYQLLPSCAYSCCFPWQFYRFSKPHHVPYGSKSFSKRQQVLFQHIKTVS